VKHAVTILDAIRDKHLFAPWFRKPESWQSWFAFLAVLFALPMTPEQLAIFQQCTARDTPPSTPTTEAWLICGRRAGKSFVLALVAVYLACFHEWRKYLAPGERGTIVIIATDRRQARTIFRYVRGLLNGVPMLARMIERETAEAFDLTNSVTIEIQAASYRSTRGYTLIAALCDETAFWRSDESRQSRQGNPSRPAASHGHYPRCDVVVCVQPLRKTRRTVGRLPQELRQRWPRAGVESTNADHEPECTAARDRRRHRS
jgi:hypothetical protein